MNTMIMTSLLRQVIFIIAGYFGLAGLTQDGDTVNALVAAIVIILNSGWATWTRRQKNVVADAAKIVPVPAASQKEVGIKEVIKPQMDQSGK